MRHRLILCFFCAALSPAASQINVQFPSEDGTQLNALQFEPERSPTPAKPAIVLLHGCSGLTAQNGKMFRRDRDWAERLAAAGFIVVLPDSFGSRGLGSQCAESKRGINPRGRAADAFGTLAYLRARTDIDKGRIFVMGWSNGGSTVLRVAGATHAPQFTRAIAFYPGCKPLLAEGWSPRIPTSILQGVEDDWTPIEPCEALAQRGGNVTLDAFAGAHHDFDAPDQPLRQRQGIPFSKRGDGIVTLGTHESSRQRAIKIVMDLIAQGR